MNTLEYLDHMGSEELQTSVPNCQTCYCICIRKKEHACSHWWCICASSCRDSRFTPRAIWSPIPPLLLQWNGIPCLYSHDDMPLINNTYPLSQICHIKDPRTHGSCLKTTLRSYQPIQTKRARPNTTRNQRGTKRSRSASDKEGERSDGAARAYSW